MTHQSSPHLQHVSFAKLAETSPAAITKVNQDGKVVYANDKVEEILGVQKSKIVSRSYDELVREMTDFDGNKVSGKKPLFQLLKTIKEPVTDVRYAIEGSNGERKLVSVNASPLFDDNGNFDGMIAVINDITDQNRTEKEKTSLLKDLGERNKELNLLYEIASLSTEDDVSLEVILQQVVEKLPSAWQYPEKTCARIAYESEEFTTDDFTTTDLSQTASIKVDEKEIGSLEVYYQGEKTEVDNDPFLDRESELIDSIAHVLGQIISKRRAKLRRDHLDSILRSVRKVNRLLIKAEEKSGLAEGTCDILAESRGFQHVRIIFIDDSIKVIDSAGQDKVLEKALNKTESGNLPNCLEEALGQKGALVIRNPEKECADYPLPEISEDNSLLVAGLEYEDRVYGVLTAIAPSSLAEEKQEQNLFAEVAEDIGSGLYNIETRKNLRERESQFMRAQEVAKVGSWRIDLETGRFFCSEQTYRIFEIPVDEPVFYQDVMDLVPEEDRERADDAWERIMGGEKSGVESRIVVESGTKWVKIRAAVTQDDEGKPKEMIGSVQDITERKKAEKKLRRSEEKFRSYVENAPVGVFLVDKEGNYLEVNEAACELTGYSEEELLNMNVSDLYASGSIRLLQSAFEELLKTGEMSIGLPYKRKNGTEGYFLLSAVELSENRFLGFTVDITKQKETEHKLEEATIGVLQALNRTIEAKDEYTGEHIDRVQKYSVGIARHFDLSDDRIQQLRYASILHDVGKIGVPDSILGKPAELTEEEWGEMEKHPKIGERIVKKVDRLKRAAKIIGQHQEKYDGTGYPGGLEGEGITMEARIIAVADAWDAMRTDRPYRDALPKVEAIKELKENSGTQFDPEVVDVMLDMIEEGEVGNGEEIGEDGP